MRSDIPEACAIDGRCCGCCENLTTWQAGVRKASRSGKREKLLSFGAYDAELEALDNAAKRRLQQRENENARIGVNKSR